MMRKTLGLVLLGALVAAGTWAKDKSQPLAAKDNRQVLAPAAAPVPAATAKNTTVTPAPAVSAVPSTANKGSLTVSPATPAKTGETAAAKPAEAVPPSDKDLDGLPDDYRNRVIAFRTLIRQEPTREAKIKKAVELLNKKSIYCPDAVVFLSRVRAEGVLDDLWRAAREDQTLRGHVAVAYGEMEDPAAIPYLISLLGSANSNVRQSAYRSLIKLSGQDLGYDSEDADAKRQEAIAKYKDWWKANKGNLKRKPAPTEQDQEAEEKWRLYGLPYLDKPAQSPQP